MLLAPTAWPINRATSAERRDAGGWGQSPFRESEISGNQFLVNQTRYGGITGKPPGSVRVTDRSAAKE